MGWTTQKYLNLRSTLAFKTDDADSVFVGDGSISLPVYPLSVSLDGDTFNVGWVVGGGTDGARNRNAANDDKLAGTHFITNSATSPKEFKVQLLGGTGEYEIRLASGDPDTNGTTNPFIEIYDDSILLLTIDGTAGKAQFMDATGTNYTAANWPGSNSAVTLNFQSTNGVGGTPILRIKCGRTATATFTMLNTIGIKKVTNARHRLCTCPLIFGRLIEKDQITCILSRCKIKSVSGCPSSSCAIEQVRGRDDAGNGNTLISPNVNWYPEIVSRDFTTNFYFKSNTVC